MTPAQTYTALQKLAREQRRPVSEILTLYGLERVLARLAQTKYAEDFVLKGGVLLAAYHLRRPTRDIDMQAVDLTLDEQHLREVVESIAAVDSDDSLVIDLDTYTATVIRDDDEYTGIRIGIIAKVHTAKLSIKLDVSTGDPIWPNPQSVEIEELLGGSFHMAGHPLETVIAEKSVTILQRGTASTRWRDFYDLRNIFLQHRLSADSLREAIGRVALHREQDLGSLADATVGYGAVGQPKWAAWRAKFELEDDCHEQLDDQMRDIADFLDPIFVGTVGDDAQWDSAGLKWETEPDHSLGRI